MVIVTRSYERSEKMSVPQELCDYFSELIQPLGTDECLEEMFQKLKQEVVTKFEERFIDQNKKKIDELEERASYQEKYHNRLNCLRIHGIESKKNEKIDDVSQKVKECYESVQVSFAQEDIDRAHRMGMEYMEKNSEKEVKSIIVKLKS